MSHLVSGEHLDPINLSLFFHVFRDYRRRVQRLAEVGGGREKGKVTEEEVRGDYNTKNK